MRPPRGKVALNVGGSSRVAPVVVEPLVRGRETVVFPHVGVGEEGYPFLVDGHRRAIRLPGASTPGEAGPSARTSAPAGNRMTIRSSASTFSFIDQRS